MNVLGLKITAHDTGAAVMSESGVVAIAEERLNRVKHSRGMFPYLSIAYCLHAMDLEPEDIDLIVMDQVSDRSVVKMKEIFLRWDAEKRFARAKIEVINHHDAHAASAFFCSPFTEAAILVYDGSGEQFVTHLGVKADETETYYYGSGNTFSILDKTLHTRLPNRRFPYTFGIGKLYSYLSAVYVNFGRYNEGKLMGLAAYGDSRILKEYPLRRWFCDHLGQLVCNAQIRFPGQQYSAVPLVKKLFQPKAAAIIVRLVWTKCVRVLRPLFLRLLMATDRKTSMFLEDPCVFKPIHLPKPRRPKDFPLPDSYYASIAYAAQKVLESFAIASGKKLKKLTNTDTICVAGGVGLNIDANKHFIKEVGFKNIFVQPGASDTGIPLGCALYGWHMIAKMPRSWEMRSASLGRKYSDKEIEAALSKFQGRIRAEKPVNTLRKTAQLIADGRIIGWFHGGSEYGPRSLGNRSILCNAAIPRMKDILNNTVKHRESWRPFAASILAEHVQDWFDLDIPSPFMLFEGQVRKDKRDRIPSVVHVDGTSRIQAVSPASNARYYELIKEFFGITGVPLVLNTSFNLGGDPIVETPEDALDTFVKTKMDYLILEDFIVSKEDPSEHDTA